MRIGLRVVVEYGLNLAEVAATVRSQVAYDLQRLTGLPVESGGGFRRRRPGHQMRQRVLRQRARLAAIEAARARINNKQ